jgi:hypothetical protein
LPPVLKDVREYKAIMYAEQPEMFNYFKEIETVLNNQFILTLTEYGVERWEKMLRIVPKGTYTLDERKFTILALLSKQLPYTVSMLYQLLTDLCGDGYFEIDLKSNKYEIDIRLEFLSDNNAEIVGRMLREICPANLICTIVNDKISTVTIHLVGFMFHSKTYHFSTNLDLTEYIDIDSFGTINLPGVNMWSKNVFQTETIQI